MFWGAGNENDVTVSKFFQAGNENELTVTIFKLVGNGNDLTVTSGGNYAHLCVIVYVNFISDQNSKHTKIFGNNTT
jgi:hypothetical protein